MPKLRDVSGQKFGRLTAICICGKTDSNHTLWELSCDCGNKTIAEIAHLISGRRVSCGCAKNAGSQLKPKKSKHGHCKNGKSTKTYRIWSGMLSRCNNKNTQQWNRYGGRGISVCERWGNFENFLEDMGECPENLSIDRINNDGNYEPKNCRWATDTEQKRNTSYNTVWMFNGESLTIAGWAEKLGLNRHTLADRVRKSKWTIEKALTTDVMSLSEIAYLMNKKRWGYEKMESTKP